MCVCVCLCLCLGGCFSRSRSCVLIKELILFCAYHFMLRRVRLRLGRNRRQDDRLQGHQNPADDQRDADASH
jgi:hypothetical protein